MLSIITTTIFFSAFIAQFVISYKVNKLRKRLRHARVELFPWTRFSAVRAYKKLARETENKVVKHTAIEIVSLLNIASVILFGSFIFIFLLIALNGIFKWNI